ncbi:hypothetical protein FALCPG4_010231 [Fusarium falciforme]
MRDLLNKFLYGSSLSEGANDGSRTLSIRPSPEDSNAFLIIPEGAPKEAPPLYTISKRDGKPNFVAYRGLPIPENIIGTATMHFTTTTIDLSIFNQHMVVKNSLSGNWSFETSHMGKFKWKVNQMTGSSYELYDRAERKLAKYGSAGITRPMEKQVSVFVPCDDFFTVTIVLSIMACKELDKINEKVAGKLINGLVGI